ncbi:MAG TPA: nucleotide sugar dehydrogenase [Candidatus Paceibacterota bacterium]|nr:nucleotide sugar dehydrogenase [Candidatus Paceibacterota bacterium]
MSPEQLEAMRRERRSMDGIRPRRRFFVEPKRRDAKLAVLGLGYVGLPLSILAASKGFEVIGFDIDEVKVAQLEKREANFLDQTAADAFRDTQNLSVSSDESTLDGADVFIICVPTPVRHDRQPDLEPLEGAARIAGRHLTEGGLVVVESTVNPGVCEEVVLPLLEEASGLSREEFLFAHCPERVNPGDERWDAEHIPRVIGGLNAESLSKALSIYSSFIDAKLLPMGSIKEAEAVKMVENSFRDINIAFVNELAMAFDKAGIDIVNVIKGASTKPFGFMPHYPGAGVGGHCIPVDPYYLIRYGRDNGFEHEFLLTARRINERMPRYVVDRLASAFRQRKLKFSGARVALLGLSYKKDIPDVRESPALVIREKLEQAGATVAVFDPYVGGAGRSLEEALRGAQAVVIATDHTMFCHLTPRQFEEFGISIVIDGRNCLDKKLFEKSAILYRGIGRS